jgi:7-carboxy-7-deazaguanine synthase
MKINEIFFSIQGESSFAGLPCVFIRSATCNLRCTYCDTKYAYFEGTELSIENIFEQIEKYPSKLIELTGGEPLLQKEINTLALQLIKKNYTVLCETSGSLDIDILDNRVHRIVDIKTPDSGEQEKNLWSNMGKLTAKDEIKFVICSMNDYEWAKKIIETYSLLDKVTVLFSPEFEKMKASDLAEAILKDGLKVRFQLQLHKFIWSPDQRAV